MALWVLRIVQLRCQTGTSILACEYFEVGVRVFGPTRKCAGLHVGFIIPLQIMKLLCSCIHLSEVPRLRAYLRKDANCAGSPLQSSAGVIDLQ